MRNNDAEVTALEQISGFHADLKEKKENYDVKIQNMRFCSVLDSIMLVSCIIAGNNFVLSL